MESITPEPRTQPRRRRATAAVILAAGRSSRLGRDKALLPVGEATLIEHVLCAFATEGIGQRVVVASSANAADLRRVVPVGVRVVVNPVPDSEMIDSIRCGLAALPSSTSALIHPVDHFAVTRSLVRALLRAAHSAPGLICVPQAGGHTAHPVLLPPEAVQGVLAWRGTGGLRAFIQEHAPLVRVSWPDTHLLLDIDDEAAYRQALSVIAGMSQG